MVKIYDMFSREEAIIKFDEKQVKQIIKAANQNGFLLIQDSFKSVPRKILTSIGVIEVVSSYEKEAKKQSKHTGDCMYFENMFVGIEYVGENFYKTISNNLLVYLYSKPRILLDYINTKHNLELKLEDIKMLDLEIEKKKNYSEIMSLVSGVKRNNKKIKEKTYVKLDNGVVELINNKINVMYI